MNTNWMGLWWMKIIPVITHTKRMASKVLGFTGGDNQGIIGLEVQYDAYLQGIEGTILTTTDARGIEVENTSEGRVEPIPGSDLYIKSGLYDPGAMSSRLQKESWNRRKQNPSLLS